MNKIITFHMRDSLLSALEKLGVEISVSFKNVDQFDNLIISKRRRCINYWSPWELKNIESENVSHSVDYLEERNNFYTAHGLMFFERLARFPKTGAYSTLLPHKRSTLHDYSQVKELFEILYDFIVKLLSEEKPDAIIFQYRPHLLVDDLLYLIARKEKINCYFCEKSNAMSDRFFISENPANIFSNLLAPTGNEPRWSTTETDYTLDLSYMTVVKEGYAMSGLKKILYNKAKSNFKLSTVFAGVSLLVDYIRMRYRDMLPNSILAITGVLKPISLDAKFEEYIYFTENKRIEKFRKQKINIKSSKDLNKDINYLYFPLHVQPEATTGSSGDLTIDQLFAVKALSAILPDNFKLLVKEHPLQSSVHRSKGFYEHLCEDSKVLLIDPSIKTGTLLDLSNVRGVATIRGTVGYEAILRGKFSIIFQDCWYQGFPNVFRFSKNLCFEHMLDKVDVSLDFESLERVAFWGHPGKIIRSKMGWQESMDSITANQIMSILTVR